MGIAEESFHVPGVFVDDGQEGQSVMGDKAGGAFLVKGVDEFANGGDVDEKVDFGALP